RVGLAVDDVGLALFGRQRARIAAE
ncbi:FMN reductase, partial [Mesorhizobium sp. M8A.F.Ca.ET.023.02.2.1]